MTKGTSERPATLADLEIFGMQLGIQAAQRLIRGYAISPLMPDKSKVAVILHFQKIVDDFVREQRATNGLTNDGEAAYRKGYARGYQSQLNRPFNEIKIKRVNP